MMQKYLFLKLKKNFYIQPPSSKIAAMSSLEQNFGKLNSLNENSVNLRASTLKTKDEAFLLDSFLIRKQLVHPYFKDKSKKILKKR